MPFDWSVETANPQALNSLTLQSGGGVTVGPLWGLVNYLPTLSDLRINSGGLLAFSGNSGNHRQRQREL